MTTDQEEIVRRFLTGLEALLAGIDANLTELSTALRAALRERDEEIARLRKEIVCLSDVHDLPDYDEPCFPSGMDEYGSLE